MNLKSKIAYVLLLFSLSSCVITERLLINEDNSGTIIYEMDGSSMMTMLEEKMGKPEDTSKKGKKKSKKESLVVSGSNNIGVQQLTNKLNNMLQTYGTTIDLSNPINLFQSEDAKVSKLVKDVRRLFGSDHTHCQFQVRVRRVHGGIHWLRQ